MSFEVIELPMLRGAALLDTRIGYDTPIQRMLLPCNCLKVAVVGYFMALHCLWFGKYCARACGQAMGIITRMEELFEDISSLLAKIFRNACNRHVIERQSADALNGASSKCHRDGVCLA